MEAPRLLYSKDANMTRKIAYEPHPVHPARKAKLRSLGYRIVDSRFAPAGVEPYTRTDGDEPVQAEPELPPVPAALVAAFDYDGDGSPGGSLPASQRGLDELKAEAHALGVKVDRRWGERRLRAEIDAAKGD
jgi:hypothetical protein